MSGSSASLCKDCFYRHRTNPDIHCIHYNVSNEVCVRWNDEESRHETTDHIRPFPEHLPGHVRHVAMCDPHRGTCRQDKCMFAHGRTEQKAWNAILRGYARNHTGSSDQAFSSHIPQVQQSSPWPDLGQQQPQYFGQRQPVQQQPQYFGQQQPVQQQPQYFGQRQPVQQQPQYFGLRQPVQQQPQYFDQRQPVQQQPQYFDQRQPVQQQPQYFGQRQPVQQQPHQQAGVRSQGQHRIMRDRSYAASQETFEGRLKGELLISDIEVELDRHNYKKKFHNLICWEERRHIETLQSKCDQKYSFTIFKRGVAPELLSRKSPRTRYGYLSNVSNDQIDYATQASEGAVIVSQDEDRQFEVKLEILQVNNQSSDEKMYVSFHEDKTVEVSHVLSQPVPQGAATFHDVAVEFEVHHSYFNSLIRAVNNIPTAIIDRILPTPADFFRLIDYPNEHFASLLAMLPPGIEIDHGDQFKALHALLSCDQRSPPIIVNGSFGTGKTRLLAVITHCVIQYGISHWKPVRVLICSHHQASADNFIDQYFGIMFKGRSDIELVRLTSLIYRSRSPFSRFYQTYQVYIDNQSRRRPAEYLVMVTTFLTAPRLRKVFEAGFFTHIFLDEGAQSREPDAIAPLCLADRNTKLVIAGDSHQVGPSLLVLGKKARENGLKLSLLERLQILYEKCGENALLHMVSLNTNYRCNKDVMRIPNDLFYDSKIKPCSQNASTHPQADYPLLFVCSSLTSDVNHYLEANLLLEQIRRFVIESWPKCWGDKDVKKACLTTASQTQLVITRQTAREKFQDLRYMRMVTSYNVQGQEFQAVFISTTEPVDCDGNTTNPTKSPCDPFIFNTVLTRSKSLVVAVGSPEALLQTENHMVKLYGEKARCWSSYMRLCLEKGTFIVPPEVEDDSVAFRDRLSTQLGVHHTTRPSATTRRSTAPVKQLPQMKHISAVPSATNSSVSGLSMPTGIHFPKSVPKQHVSTPAIPQHPPRSSLVSSARNSESAFLQKEPPVSTTSIWKQPKSRATPSVQHPLAHQKQQTLSPGQVSHPINSGSSSSSQRSSKATAATKSPHDDTEYPSLMAAKEVSKKEGKQMAEKSQRVIASKKDQLLNISSPNVATPACHSKFYEEYKDKLSGYYPVLKNEELTADNYTERFHHLLCWEEQEHDRQLAQRCNKVYSIKIFQKGFIPGKLRHEYDDRHVRYGYIDSEDSDTLVHAKQASEGSFLILDNHSHVHAKHVHATVPNNANFNAIVIAFNEEQEVKLRGSKFYDKKDYCFQAEVRFELKHSYFQRLHSAIYHLKQVINRLIPTDSVLYSRKPVDLSIDYTDEVEYTYPRMKLDEVQMKALKCILESHSALPVLIAGPFGTGKTRVLARAAYEILRYENTRVLICAHHQTSVDTFVEYFGEMVYDREDPWSIGMIRITPGFYRSTTNPDYNHFFKSAGALSYEDFEYNRLFITTLGTSLKLFRHIPGKYKDFFSHILIDEGAQTREPEIAGPLTLAGFNTKIVIAGDHCQVGPKLLVLGKEAQSNGLGISLLERLHAQYDKRQFPSKRFCSVTLLTNHRCHSGILMLPSSLYYHSTLRCGKKNDTPHHLVPFPLTFVCSDVKQPNSETSGVNEAEADVIMKEVEKYFKTWPKSWSRQEKRICIMSPSADQCSLLRDKKRKLKVDCEVEILKAYDIQGTEFPAIFISTSEPTTKNGDPINTTKSICDRYVFNTAITRSKLLVVAVGNPFLLLKMEKNMIQKHDSTYKTWSPYIKQCIECETFSYAQSVKQTDPSQFFKATHRLYGLIHSESAIQSCANPNPPSSIIRAYKKVFESIPECIDTKLILSNSKDSRLTWCIEDNRMQDEPEEEEVCYSDHYICNLRIDTFRKAEAIPYNSSKKIVKIRGLKNRKGAFDGDSVKVGVFNDNPPNKCYGRIVEVTERGGDLKFVCRVSPSSPIVFFPIDKKNPKFVNLPGLSRVLLRKKKGERFERSDLESSDVVVFDPNTYDLESEEVPLPRISQVIPISVARNMLFLVSFVRWKEKYSWPLGIVIGAYCKGHTLYNAERLLKFVHSVDYSSSSDANNAPSCEAIEDQNLQLYDRAFTIDPEEAQNLDDALSITRVGKDHDGCDVYQLGVHIVNAAKHIQPDTEYDKLIRSTGISVYGGEKGKIMHMLPDHSTRYQLSLAPGKVRDVISVTCKVTLNNPLNFADMDFNDCNINPAQMKSVVQLTYMDAQCIMDGAIPEKHSEEAMKFDEDRMQPSFQDSMRLLFAIAKFRRQERLQSDAAFAYDVNDPEEAFCWQSHMLVEELMIWANNEVAKRVHALFPNAAILRRQAPPNAEQKQATVDEDQSIMACSLYLSHYLLDENTHASPDVDILIPHDTLRLLQNALSKGNKTLLAHLLSADRLYPQLAAVCSKFRSIFLRAEYCCTRENQRDAATYRHDSLCLDDYTHFTSPMRRYIDIEIQRMLLESGKEPASRCEFSHEKQSELCINLNAKKKNASDYERKLKNVKCAIKFTASSEVYMAFISQEVKSSLEFSFPDLELSYFPNRAKSLNITHFLPSSKESDLYVWKVRITSLKSDFAVHLLEIDDFSLSEPASSNAFNLRAFCSSSIESSSLDTERYVTSQHSSVVKVSSSCWLEALEFVKDPSEDKMARVEEVLPFVPSSPSPCPLDLRKAHKRYLFFDCDVKASLKESDVFKVWLTWTLREPVISPAIQLVEISPLLRICMQHNSHPAECFSDPNLSPASRMDYETISDYIELWKKLLLAEAAEKSVKECQPVIIQDVLLHWPKFKIPEECIEEQYYVPTGSVKMIYPEDFVEHCYEFFRVLIGSLVCVRYNCDSRHSSRAVYHFVVHQVKMPDSQEDDAQKEIVVSMEPVGKWNCRVSATMKDKLESEKYTCEVQIILMSPSYRRVFGGLLALGRRGGDASKLSQGVAVDRYQIRDRISYFKQAESVAGKDKLVKSLSEWTCSGNSSKVLNKWQEKAMYKALCKPFQLIQGPPGTGKSVTGARIAYAFAIVNRQLNTPEVHKCVLYCGPSNKSVDVVFEQFKNMLKARKNSDLRILRIYGTAVEKNDYPGPKHEAKRRSDIKCPDWAKPYALHHLIREQEGKLQELDQQLKDMEKGKKIASGKSCKEHRQVLAKTEADFLSKAKVDIIFCTCNEASGLRVGKHVSVRQCIIDECGMAYEPETIIPISKCEHAVLIGDHKQLQPVIDYQPAKENGLTTSLFERYAMRYQNEKDRAGDNRYIFTLKTQYRMHEAICEFPSEMFYDGQLETDISVKNRPDNEHLETFWPRGNRHPIMFVDVVGEEGLDKIASSKAEVKVGVDSKFNLKEAELVIKIAQSLHLRHKVAVREIAVLTPYSAQKSKLLDMVKKLPGELQQLKIASVTESQGDEYGIVILSTVRSQPREEIRHKHYVQPDHTWRREHLGFITDKHQINVGITRSKYGLIITGNKTLLEYDITWESLLKHYGEKRCVVDASRF